MVMLVTALIRSVSHPAYYLPIFCVHRKALYTSSAQSRSYCSDGYDGSKLSKREHWISTYDDPVKQQMDWFTDDQIVVDEVLSLLSNQLVQMDDVAHILDLGCGTAKLAINLASYSTIPVCIHCLDYVPSAVLFQRQLFHDRKLNDSKTSSAHFVVADALNLPYVDDLFNLVIDKGTIDSLLKSQKCGEQNASRLLMETMTCLKPGGKYVQITDEDPDSRLYFMERTLNRFGDSYSIGYKSLNVVCGIEYFMYITSKEHHYCHHETK